MLDKNSTTNEFLHQVFQQHQLDLVPEIELTSNDLLIDLARIGLGIAFVPDYCVTGQSDDLFLLRTKEELPCRELAVAYNDQLPMSRASMEFLSYFQKRFYIIFHCKSIADLTVCPFSRETVSVLPLGKPFVQQQYDPPVRLCTDHASGRL